MSKIHTADAVIFAGSDRPQNSNVLLIRRAYEPFADHWALPGGHVDPGESPLNAAVRELAEETGISVADLLWVDTYTRAGRDPRGPYVSDAFVTHIRIPVQVRADDDAAEARWIPYRELDGMPLGFDHRLIIHEAAIHCGTYRR